MALYLTALACQRLIRCALRSLPAATLKLSWSLTFALIAVAGTCAQNISPPVPQRITFEPANPTVGAGDMKTITATVRDDEGKKIEGAEVEWIIPKGTEDAVATGEQTGTTIKVIGLNPRGKDGGFGGNLIPIIARFKGAPGVTAVVNVRVEALPVARGPIPPNLDPQVDVMWTVLPSDITGHNFGRSIKHSYYGVEVVIGNNTGYDLQVASVGFDLPLATGVQNRVPSTGFRVARGSAERARELYPRNIILNTIRALGPVLTGVTPYFRNISHRGNFTEAVNIFSNPLEKGIDLVVPDLSIEELNRLQDQLLRDDITTRTVIPNNTQVRTLVFVPKRFLRQSFTAGENKDDPQTIMKKLGHLVLKGDKIDYLNRVRVVAVPAAVGEHSIAGRITDGCGSALPGVTVTLSGGAIDFRERTTVTGARGDYQFDGVPSGLRYVVTPALSELIFAPIRSSRDPNGVGHQSFIADESITNVDFEERMEKYSIAGKVTGIGAGDASAIKVVVKRGQTEVAQAGLSASPDHTYELTGIHAGSMYTLMIPDTPAFKFSGPRDVNLRCNQRDVDFTATPIKPPK